MLVVGGSRPDLTNEVLLVESQFVIAENVVLRVAIGVLLRSKDGPGLLVDCVHILDSERDLRV